MELEESLGKHQKNYGLPGETWAAENPGVVRGVPSDLGCLLLYSGVQEGVGRRGRNQAVRRSPTGSERRNLGGHTVGDAERGMVLLPG